MGKIIMQQLIRASRYILAVLFIFSGFVKGVDPLGSTYKFVDYFMAFNMQYLVVAAKPLAFILCAAELYLGLLLLFKSKVRIAIWGIFLFMLGFTPLTLVLAIYNPVSDCGCFGDALILSNWETFFKNLFFMAAATFLLVKRKQVESTHSKKLDWTIAIISAVISFAPSFYGYNNLPLIDFRPYSIGTNIPDAMSIPPDAPLDEYKTLLYYEKDGKEVEFTEENFPWQDTTWKFVDSKSVLVKKGYTPPIHDFVLTTIDGWNQTDSILQYPGYFMLAISYRIDRANEEAIDKLNQLYYTAKDHGIGFAYVTSSPQLEIDDFIGKTGAVFPFLQADEIMLKTVIRAYPGLVLLKEGTIIGKWHYNNFPEPEFFKGNIDAKLAQHRIDIQDNLWSLNIAFGIFILYLLGRLANPKRRAKKE
jgi:hypothetical protein